MTFWYYMIYETYNRHFHVNFVNTIVARLLPPSECRPVRPAPAAASLTTPLLRLPAQWPHAVTKGFVLIQLGIEIKTHYSRIWHRNILLTNYLPTVSHFGSALDINLLHSAITFHHFFTVSLWAQNLPFQKILSSTLVCFCLSDWSHGSTPFTGLICSSVLMF